MTDATSKRVPVLSGALAMHGFLSSCWISNKPGGLSMRGFLRRGGMAVCLLSAVVLIGCHSDDFPDYPPNFREYAYVTNGVSGTVSVIDVVNVRLDREIPVGADPVAVAASPTRNEVYVVNAGTPAGQGSLSVIDAEKNAVGAVIPLHRQPVSIAVDGDGKLAYVANSGSNSISIVDLAARREVAQLGVGEQPDDVRLSPDGKSLVVSNRGGNSVTILSPRTRRVRAIFGDCPGAGDAVILPDSSKAFVACSAGHRVMVIALADSKFNPGGPDRVEALMDVGHAPVHIALKPDGGEIFVSNSLSDSVSEIYNTTDEVGDTYLIGAHPVFGLVSSDNLLLYVANVRSQEVTIYSIEDGRRAGSIHVGDGPSAMAFSAAGHLLFVVDSRSGDVAVVRTSSVVSALNSASSSSLLSVFTMIPTGRGPDAIAVKAFKVP